MIRFPNRFHASVTPQGNGAAIELGYQSEPRDKRSTGKNHTVAGGRILGDGREYYTEGLEAGLRAALARARRLNHKG